MSDMNQAVPTNKTEPGGPIPAVVAIIVGALNSVSGVLAAAVTEAARETIFTTGSKVNQAAVISNRCHVALKQTYVAEPASGAYYKSPPSSAAALPAPKTAFEMWKLSPESPKSVKNVAYGDVTVAQAKLLAVWIKVTLGPKLDNTIFYVMKSSGAGVEGLSVYEMDGYTSSNKSSTIEIFVVFYLNNPFIGSTEAGGVLLSKREFDKFYSNVKRDRELQNLIDYIQERNFYSSGERKTFEYSPGSNTDPSAVIYTLSYQASEITNFDLLCVESPS